LGGHTSQRKQHGFPGQVRIPSGIKLNTTRQAKSEGDFFPGGSVGYVSAGPLTTQPRPHGGRDPTTVCIYSHSTYVSRYVRTSYIAAMYVRPSALPASKVSIYIPYVRVSVMAASQASQPQLPFRGGCIQTLAVQASVRRRRLPPRRLHRAKSSLYVADGRRDPKRRSPNRGERRVKVGSVAETGEL